MAWLSRMKVFSFISLFLFGALASASETSLIVPNLGLNFNIFGSDYSGTDILQLGIVIVLAGMVFGIWEFFNVKKLPAHKSMLDISHLIYETCKTYLIQQGRFLVYLELAIGACIFIYFC